MPEDRIELLLGRPVVARNGRRIGRIEEIRADDNGYIVEFLVGERALLERLSALGLFNAGKRKGYSIRWDQLDLSDLAHPRLNCTVDELNMI